MIETFLVWNPMYQERHGVSWVGSFKSMTSSSWTLANSNVSAAYLLPVFEEDTSGERRLHILYNGYFTRMFRCSSHSDTRDLQSRSCPTFDAILHVWRKPWADVHSTAKITVDVNLPEVDEQNLQIVLLR